MNDHIFNGGAHVPTVQKYNLVSDWTKYFFHDLTMKYRLHVPSEGMIVFPFSGDRMSSSESNNSFWVPELKSLDGRSQDQKSIVNDAQVGTRYV